MEDEPGWRCVIKTGRGKFKEAAGLQDFNGRQAWKTVFSA
jgi:hypothetical protein